MMENYAVSYSAEALDDLRGIYTYIAKELLSPETAASQIWRLRKEISSLHFMPARYAFVEWDPWHSMGMHQLPVDNFIIYYLIDEETTSVLIVRIFYGGRNIEGIISSK